MKVVADADSRRILGAAILGTGGDEAIYGILDMMSADQPVETFRSAVPIHPTVSELIPTMLQDLSGRPAVAPAASRSLRALGSAVVGPLPQKQSARL